MTYNLEILVKKREEFPLFLYYNKNIMYSFLIKVLINYRKAGKKQRCKTRCFLGDLIENHELEPEI